MHVADILYSVALEEAKDSFALARVQGLTVPSLGGWCRVPTGISVPFRK
jgi:hypothetical protein